METGGRYITCGYKNQHPDFSNMKMKRPLIILKYNVKSDA